MPSFCSLLLNDTASTAIYTYLHTLSLHDALPILWLLHRLQLLPGGGDLPRHQGTGDPRHGGIGAGGRAREGVSRTGGDRLGAGHGVVVQHGVVAFLGFGGGALEDRCPQPPIVGPSPPFTSNIYALLISTTKQC